MNTNEQYTLCDEPLAIITVRVPKSVHAAAVLRAAELNVGRDPKEKRVSLNTFCVDAILEKLATSTPVVRDI